MRYCEYALVVDPGFPHLIRKQSLGLFFKGSIVHKRVIVNENFRVFMLPIYRERSHFSVHCNGEKWKRSVLFKQI